MQSLQCFLLIVDKRPGRGDGEPHTSPAQETGMTTMSTDLVLPALPFGAAEVTVLRWLRQPGDALAAGEPLLIAANEQVEAALPAPAAGTLAAILAPEGAAAQVGAPVARLAPPRRLRITPLARRIAQALGLPLHTLSGSGPGGRVMRRDLPGADQQPTTSAPALNTPALDHSIAPALQRSIAPALTPAAPQPLSTECHALTAAEVDLGAVLDWCARQGAGPGRAAATPLACVARAAVAALLRFPLLNAAWHERGIVVRRRVHLELRPGGPAQGAALIIPDAQDLNLRGLARALARPRPAEAPPAPTFCLAESAGWSDAGAPAPGQSARLSLGALSQRPAVVSQSGAERIGVRPLALLCLAYDARVLDQPLADAYLAALRQSLAQFSG